MSKSIARVVGAVAMVLTVSAGGAWAEAKITVTREESKHHDRDTPSSPRGDGR